jgi:hypothetical protein
VHILVRRIVNAQQICPTTSNGEQKNHIAKLETEENALTLFFCAGCYYSHILFSTHEKDRGSRCNYCFLFLQPKIQGLECSCGVAALAHQYPPESTLLTKQGSISGLHFIHSKQQTLCRKFPISVQKRGERTKEGRKEKASRG